MPTETVAAHPVHLAAALPRVTPVPLVTGEEAFDDPAWVFEPKYDGCRALLYGLDQGCEIELLQEAAVHLGDLRRRVAEVLDGRDGILEGEVVALDSRGRPALQHLLRGEGYLAFAAYDVLWLNGTDLRNLPLRERKERLADVLPQDTGPLYKILMIEQYGRALYGAIQRMELPGIVAKCLNDPYSPETRWYEIRNGGRQQSDLLPSRPRPRYPSRSNPSGH